MDKFGGEAFRAAVSDGQTELAKLLLEKGADINYHKPDMVFPNRYTYSTEAARSNNFSMVRWLVEQERISPLLTNTVTGPTVWQFKTKIRSWPTI